MLRFRPALRPKHRRPAQRAIIVLSLLLLVAQATNTAYWLWRSYRQTIDGAGAALEDIARSAAVDTSGLLSEIDAMLLCVQRSVATSSANASLDTRALDAILDGFDRRKVEVSDILILDGNGRVAKRAEHRGNSFLDYSGPPLFAGHPPRIPAGLFIGALAPGAASSAWSIMISRPLNRDGVRLGTVVAAVPVQAFGDRYRAIAPTGKTRIELLLNDGTPIVAEPAQDAAIGSVTRFAATLSRSAGRDSNNFLGAVGRTNHAGVQVFRRVTGYPMFVSVSGGGLSVLRRWWQDCAISLIGFLLAAATLAAIASTGVGALGRFQLAAARRRRGEATLKRQTALLQTTLENIGEGLSVFDRHRRLVARNQRFNELLDLPANLPLGTALEEVLGRQAARGDFGDLEPKIETARRLEEFYQEVPVTKERVTPGGRTLQIRRRDMPAGAILSIYSDITELKNSELNILRARSQAESASRSKSEFLANMSHELRTPLNAIIGFSEIISSELFGPLNNQRYLEYIRDILASSMHLLSIINDVLDMSKIEAGKLELAKEAVTLQAIVRDVLRMMRERASIRGISLVPCMAEDDIVMWADERALTQILLNLLANAIKFSDEGGTVIIRLATTSAGRAVIEVEDRGIGMTAEEQERALQPFGQAKPVITREFGGTGLGLPISKGLVEAHGGTLTISSAVGTGTTVRIVLPTERTHAEV
jgi:signal transduction histidine kinase